MQNNSLLKTGLIAITLLSLAACSKKNDPVVPPPKSNIVTEDFSGAKSITTGKTDVATIQSEGGITTAAGFNWGLASRRMNDFWILKDVSDDASFTTAGKSYLYLKGSGYGPNVALYSKLSFYGPSRPGLKSVTITFGISQIKSIADADGFGDPQDIDVFDPKVDTLRIQIGPKVGSADGKTASTELIPGNNLSVTGPYIGVSPKFTPQAGKFYTYTYTMPTADKIKAADPLDKYSQQDLDNYTAHPCFDLYNVSYLQPDHINNVANLIIISKIEFNYDK